MTDAPLTRRELRERERAEAGRGEAQRPLTRRELRERERMEAQAPGAESSSSGTAADEAARPDAAPTAAEPLPRPAQADAGSTTAPAPATSPRRSPTSPLFPESSAVAAPRAEVGEAVLSWNPRASAADAPRRHRSTFGLPSEAAQALPVVRNPSVAPREGADSSDLDDYFARLVESSEAGEPTGGIVMPSEIDVTVTDQLPRGALPRPADPLELDGIDDLLRDGDPADAGATAPVAARSAISAGSATGFVAPSGPADAHVHARATARLPVVPASAPAPGQAEPSRAAMRRDAAARPPARSGDAEDRRLVTAVKVAAGALSAAVVGAIVLVWGVLQGWFQ